MIAKLFIPLLLIVGGGAIALGLIKAGQVGLLALATSIPAIGAPEPQWIDDLSFLLLVFVPLALIGLVGGRWLGANGVRLGRNPLTLLPLGLALGMAATASAFLILMLLGHTQVGTAPHAATLLSFAGGTLAILVQSSAEEIFFRGWIQSAISRYWGSILALFAAAILFAAMHYNVVYSWQALGNVFLAGLFFGALFRASGGILLPAMAHFAWNWTEFLLLDLLPKGENPFGNILDFDLKEGTAMFGGTADGMNASIAVTAVLLLLFALVLLVTWRRSKAKPATKAQPLADAKSPAIPVASATAIAAVAPATTVAPPPVAAAAPTRSGLRVQDDAITNVGRVREINEDRLFASKELGVWAVADGMGGHEFGERASSAIVDSLGKLAPEADFSSKIQAVRGLILAANEEIFAEATKLGQRMGSTVVALVIDEAKYAVLWAGDSRAYRYRGGVLQQISRDHTQVQSMIDRGLLAPEDAAGHPMSHVLARAIGVMAVVDVDIVDDSIEPNDIFLLCSDGLYGLVSDAEIAEALVPSRLGQAADDLIALSLERGAPDNITIVTVSASEATLISFGKDRTDSM
jgi:serine/threonine protein phosphatase Stp1